MKWGKRNELVPQAELIGMSQDAPNNTPQQKYRYNFCLVLRPGFKPVVDISVKTVPGGRYGALLCTGDIHKLDRAWNYLLRAWLPGSGHEPILEPAMEVYRGHPEQLGWSLYDIDCMVPVKPLGVR